MKKRILAVICSILLFGHFIKNYMEHLDKHLKDHEAATLFLKTSACQNSDIKARLGSFNLCEDAEQRLGYSPHIHVIFDILTDFSICGRGRCHHTIQWINHHIIYLVFFVFMVAFMIYKLYIDNKRHQQMMYWQLPMNRRIGAFIHEHRD